MIRATIRPMIPISQNGKLAAAEIELSPEHMARFSRDGRPSDRVKETKTADKLSLSISFALSCKSASQDIGLDLSCSLPVILIDLICFVLQERLPESSIVDIGIDLSCSLAVVGISPPYRLLSNE